ncbi:Serine beta-lactamase-like protein LACTB, mitochondrial [Frankliniella fusca]|uniref:Serine beta-lactamase-like protein LACTB, mitochondrial n=1 Tax=Frankliniella fusca TaxID=407009 RepID=A0AAE1H9X2_9NEOP|nr:Serine beta-lactamase-like protein LACTB, mitochondrial [Frankliniella fusca]
MASFGRRWWITSGAVGGFSMGVAASFLLRQPDQGQTTAAAAAVAAASPAPAYSPARPDQLVGGQVSVGDVVPRTSLYDAAIQASREMIKLTKEEMGIPGVSIAVNVNGKTVWTEGFGYADVENGVPCTPKTVMRIASISKSLTMAALAKLWESGKIDLDQPVQLYVPKFPKKTFEGKPVCGKCEKYVLRDHKCVHLTDCFTSQVEITTRHLVSHLAGIRHWKGGEETTPSVDQQVIPEFYMNTRFKTVEDALTIFENDELLHEPGTKYLYSSPAWTLVSVVMEKCAGISYRELMINMCNQLGLTHTRMDENDLITRNRARYYTRNKHGKLINSPCVDNSCKWAGGGFQSTVGDLVKFGDAMLYCYQGGPNGYLKRDTIEALWTISPYTIQAPKGLAPTSGYGLGWVVTPALTKCGGVEPQSFSVNHTGGAVGASSILLIVPQEPKDRELPSGVSVAMIVNMQAINLTKLARDIATQFWTAKCAGL